MMATSLKCLYRKRRMARIKGALFLFVIPLSGLAIEQFIKAESYDRKIKEISLRMAEDSPTDKCYVYED